MSNYHYDDQTNGSCCGKYVPLKQTDKYRCGPSCMDRNNSERSTKDMMYYNFFVRGKPMDLQSDTKVLKKWRNHTYRENEYI